jgi:hypothetical protein
MNLQEILAELEFAKSVVYGTKFPRRRRTVKAIKELVTILNVLGPEDYDLLRERIEGS